MRKWILRWLFSPKGSPSGAALPASVDDATGHQAPLGEPDPVLEALEAFHDPLETLCSESGETADNVRKLARAHGRSALRIEEFERKFDAHVAWIRAALSDTPPSAVGPTLKTNAGSFAPAECESVFDAMDLLDHAVASIDPRMAPGVVEGLAGVQARLEHFLSAHGLKRITFRGALPDGRLVRVVGTEPATDVVPEGHVSRVVRAAVCAGDVVVREGEVIATHL